MKFIKARGIVERCMKDYSYANIAQKESQISNNNQPDKCTSFEMKALFFKVCSFFSGISAYLICCGFF